MVDVLDLADPQHMVAGAVHVDDPADEMRQRILEQRRRWGDVHQYGVQANARTMDAFQDYNVEQGMTARKLAPVAGPQ